MFQLTDKQNYDIDAITVYNKTYILDLKSLAKCPVVYHVFGSYVTNIIYTRRNTFKNVRSACDVMIDVAARHITATQFDARLWAVAHWVTLQCDAERLGERERATNYAKRATNRFWSRLRV